MTWPHAPALQQAMLAAAGSGRAPLFLAQAVNDNSLAPTYAVGAEPARVGRPAERGRAGRHRRGRPDPHRSVTLEPMGGRLTSGGVMALGGGKHRWTMPGSPIRLM
jgi:hypothetical protein